MAAKLTTTPMIPQPTQPQFEAMVEQNVSRETFVKLQRYAELLQKWQRAINLVAPASLPELWQRHIADSYQLLPHLSPSARIIDLGSGGGFPALVIAMARPDVHVTMVESDRKKCEFLKNVSRETFCQNTQILCERVEHVPLPASATVTARGFAPITRILQWLQPHLGSTHQLLLLKGKGHEAELEEASKKWCFTTEKHASLTDAESAILRLTQIKPLDA